jgi:hypothetical protein
MIERLRECFTEDFTQWLLKSNNPKVGPYLGEERRAAPKSAKESRVGRHFV